MPSIKNYNIIDSKTCRFSKILMLLGNLGIPDGKPQGINKDSYETAMRIVFFIFGRHRKYLSHYCYMIVL